MEHPPIPWMVPMDVAEDMDMVWPIWYPAPQPVVDKAAEKGNDR